MATVPRRGPVLLGLRFAAIPLARQQRLRLLNPALQPLVKEIDRRQAAGEDMHYSMHIYREVRWRLNFTPDVAGTRAEIDLLRRSLGETDQQKLAAEQQKSDGSWGMGIDAWYLRLYYSVEDVRACHPPPHYPLAFLDRINSPQKLNAQLDADLHDNFSRTGVFNREETGRDVFCDRSPGLRVDSDELLRLRSGTSQCSARVCPALAEPGNRLLGSVARGSQRKSLEDG